MTLERFGIATKKHKIHKNSYNFSLSVIRLPPRSPSLFCVFLRLFAAIIPPATSNPPLANFSIATKKSYNFSLSESQPFSFSPSSRYQLPATRYDFSSFFRASSRPYSFLTQKCKITTLFYIST